MVAQNSMFLKLQTQEDMTLLDHGQMGKKKKID